MLVDVFLVLGVACQSSAASASSSSATSSTACTSPALFGLFRRRLPEAFRAAGGRYVVPAVAGLKGIHSGIPGDYVMWITVGAALLGGIWVLA
jgi:hypothetical protein